MRAGTLIHKQHFRRSTALLFRIHGKTGYGLRPYPHIGGRFFRSAHIIYLEGYPVSRVERSRPIRLCSGLLLAALLSVPEIPGILKIIIFPGKMQWIDLRMGRERTASGGIGQSKQSRRRNSQNLHGIRRSGHRTSVFRRNCQYNIVFADGSILINGRSIHRFEHIPVSEIPFKMIPYPQFYRNI